MLPIREWSFTMFQRGVFAGQYGWTTFTKASQEGVLKFGLKNWCPKIKPYQKFYPFPSKTPVPLREVINDCSFFSDQGHISETTPSTSKRGFTAITNQVCSRVYWYPNTALSAQNRQCYFHNLYHHYLFFRLSTTYIPLNNTNNLIFFLNLSNLHEWNVFVNFQ